MDKYSLKDYYKWKEKGDIVLVLEDEGEIKGVVDMVDKGDYLLLDMIAVNRLFRGKGIGSKMLRKVEEIAVSLGKRGIILEALESAVDFYRKNGFEFSHVRIDKEFGSLYVMLKELRPLATITS